MRDSAQESSGYRKPDVRRVETSFSSPGGGGGGGEYATDGCAGAAFDRGAGATISGERRAPSTEGGTSR